MKTCIKCGQSKSLKEFYVRKVVDGIEYRRTDCKECCKQGAKARYNGVKTTLASELDAVRKQLADERTKNGDLYSRNTVLLRDNANFKFLAESLESKLDVLTKENDGLKFEQPSKVPRQRLEAAYATIEQMQIKIDSLEAQKEKLTAFIQSQNVDIDELHKQSNVLANEVTKLTIFYSGIKNNIKSLKSCSRRGLFNVKIKKLDFDYIIAGMESHLNEVEQC